jgi:Protein of unknown function (DUF1194)
MNVIVEGPDIYYRDCVIGGPGAFMIPIKEREKVSEAIRNKLVLEVAGRTVAPQPIAAVLSCVTKVPPVSQPAAHIPIIVGPKGLRVEKLRPPLRQVVVFVHHQVPNGDLEAVPIRAAGSNVALLDNDGTERIG